MLDYIVIDNNNADLYQDGFIKLYQENFKESPYCDDCSYENILNIWNSHKDKGLIIVCSHHLEKTVIGLVCGHKANVKVTDETNQIMDEFKNKNKSADLENAVHISELAIAKGYRNRKEIAIRLINYFSDKI